MDVSNWAQATMVLRQSQRHELPRTRSCDACDGQAQLADVNDSGVAYYLCQHRHSTLVDFSRLIATDR